MGFPMNFVKMMIYLEVEVFFLTTYHYSLVIILHCFWGLLEKAM